MTSIVGFGNPLRGEDAFGHDCIKELKKEICSKDINFLTAQQLVPEHCLELIDSKKIIFLDATFDEKNHYALGNSLQRNEQNRLSHHISPNTIVYALKNLYYKEFDYEIYSIFTNSFEKINCEKSYKQSVERVVSFIKTNL